MTEVLGACLVVSIICNILLMRGGLKLQARAKRLEQNLSRTLLSYQQATQEWAAKQPKKRKVRA